MISTYSFQNNPIRIIRDNQGNLQSSGSTLPHISTNYQDSGEPTITVSLKSTKIEYRRELQQIPS